MRDWNKERTHNMSEDDYVFLAYLWGIETAYEKLRKCGYARSFLAYLWGIETTKRRRYYVLSHFSFLAYLWGIETLRSYLDTYGYRSVLSLPMRDWNRNVPILIPLNAAGS